MDRKNADFERLKAAGATVIREPYQSDEAGVVLIATFADPDNNHFQLLSPMMMMSRRGPAVSCSRSAVPAAGWCP